MTDKDTNDPTPNTESPQIDVEALQETAKPEDVSAYAEERKEQEVAEETGEPVKRASRYERLKRARDQYKQEAEELRRRLSLDPEPPSETPPENPYEDEIDQGRREAEFHEQLAARDEAIRLQTQVQMRAQEIAQHFPDFHETIQFAKDCGYNPGPVFSDLLMRHPMGPAFAYALAKDAENGGTLLVQLEELADDPVAQAREFGKMEQTVMAAMQQGQAPQQQRTTRAPAPMRPISGGSAGPRDLHSLAAKDDVSDYAKARRHA